MKRELAIVIVAVTILMILAWSVSTFAQEATTTPVPTQSQGFSLFNPSETGAVGFWFPTDGTFAGGLAHTFLRVTHSSIPKVNLDLDVTVAQEINQETHTLLGLGAKLGYGKSFESKPGFSFEPSIGITALNNFIQNKTFKDILTNYRFAVYGTILLYRW